MLSQQTGVFHDDRRHSDRVEIETLIGVTWACEPAFLLNLGTGGFALQAMEILRPTDSFRVEFPLPYMNDSVSGQAEVVWSDRAGRAGLRFTDLAQADRQRLTRWLSQKAAPSLS